MKKSILVVLIFFFIQPMDAQNFRKPYREAKRALKKKDYVTATLKSIESIKEKKNFKKSIDIFENALSQVNSWGTNYIKSLEVQAIPYKDYRSVVPMEKIFTTYARLDNLQKKLLGLPAGLSLKKKNIIIENTKDYKKKKDEAENLLEAYIKNAAEEFYSNALKIFNSATNKYEYRNAYKTFARAKNYIQDYKEVGAFMDRSLSLGTLNVGYFPLRNFTNTPYNKRAMKDLINSTIGLFNKHPFANYSDISNKIELRRLGVLGDKGKEQLKDIDELVKFKFLKYYAGPTVIKSKEYYENTKEKKKKDGSIKTWFCKGYIYQVAASGIVEVDLEFLNNNGEVLDNQRILVNVEHNDKFFLATEDSDRRAYPLLQKFTRTMPPPFDMVGALTNRFNSKVNEAFKRYD
ncbi:MAG: Uncharacterised protein [Flavobacterium sp. SCGC AAA160-P02]|nr:MAG: Uncharacterised protein [Flavobacterium sp. SCGC AAA160-P02]